MSHVAVRIGLISDTHGLLRPEALAFLRGSDYIVHAGDIGTEAIIRQLSEVAPVTAVRGNNDHGPWTLPLPETAELRVAQTRVYVIHDIAEAAFEGVDVVVSGHSHRPLIEHRNGVLFINPGSAGPRRFSLPVSVGQLLISGARVAPQVVTLAGRQA